MPSFPDDQDVQVTCEAAFGADLTQDPSTWDFIDLSDRVVTSSPITIGRGVIVGGRVNKGSSGSITLLNDDGHLTFDHPGSPWWPYVDQGTPIRVAVNPPITTYVTDTFSRTVGSGFGNPDYRIPPGSGWLETTGLSVSGGQGRIAHSGVNEILTASIFFRHGDVEVLYDTTASAVATGGSLSFGPTLRSDGTDSRSMWALMEFQTGGTIRWVLWQRVAGAYTTPGNATQPGLTYSAGTVIRCRVRYTGARIQARAWLAAGAEPSTWALDLSPSVPFDGGTYLRMRAWRQPGNTNTSPVITLDNLTARSAPSTSRAEGYIADIKPRFVPLGDGQTHSVVQIDIGGVGTRTEKRSADAMSPTRRAIQYAAAPPIAYWPLEDKREATSAASAYPDQPPMAVTGPAVFGFEVAGLVGTAYAFLSSSLGYVSLAAGAKLSAPVPASVTGAWTVSAQIDSFAANSGIGDIRLLEWNTIGGTHNRWALVGTAAGHEVRAYNDDAGTVTTVIADSNNFASLFSISVTAEQNGASIDCELFFNAVSQATGSTAGTIGAVDGLTLNPDRANTTASTDPFGIRLYYGHATVYDVVTDNAQPRYQDERPKVVFSQYAFNDEVLHERVRRLCAEERIPFRVAGDPYDSALTLLGPQPAGTFTDLLTATVESGSGDLLVEDSFGYVLIPKSERYNRAADLVVDMSSYARSGGTDPGDVLVPVLGRPGANYWTVERRNGSSATYAASEAYRRRRGTIADKATLDVFTDADCATHAQWRTHLSVDGLGATYPAFEIDLAANPGLIDAWLRCGIGSRAQWTNQPAIAGTGTIDQVIEGITETFSHSQSSGGRSWSAKLDTSPASVWDVGVYDATGSLWDSASTTLKTGVSSSATSLTFRTADANDLWSTTDEPYDVVIGGEQVTVSSMGAASLVSGAWDQAATVVRAVNGISKTLAAGEEIHVVNAGRWGL